MTRVSIPAAAVLISIGLFFATPAAAADGTILITQAKALAGNVTPGDTAGFPVTISAPGSYTLASNLEVPANKNGIVVTATEVTLDLNGFRIDGGSVAAFGIVGQQRSLTVRNGTVRGFKNDGIRSIGAMMIVENMRVEENGQNGVADTNNGYARIVNSTVFGNGAIGIGCTNSCHVAGNIISSNKQFGVYIFGKGGTVLGNTIYSNLNYGLYVVGSAGFGNNTIVDNASGPISGTLVALFPNACSPQAC